MFRKEGRLLRQVNRDYDKTYRAFIEGGLYQELTKSGLLLRHQEVGLSEALDDRAIAVLEPEFIRDITYPYEWCFSQLKDAALLTLKIQRMAVEHGMSLKDASAYNIQFRGTAPVFIDSLSFEVYRDSEPWKAYRQFCQHFVAPLVLMSHVDVRLGRLAASYIDGIPLDLASTISKPSTRFDLKIGMHIHLHARFQAKSANTAPDRQSKAGFGKTAMLGLIDNLTGLIDKCVWKPEGTEWADYYEDTNYSKSAMAEKHRMVGDFIDLVAPKPTRAWDLGANNGEFSALATSRGIATVAWDIDPAAVEKNYLKRKGDPLMLPLVQDLTNPSPAIGWAGRERDSLAQRGPVDLLIALALVHHLAIGNNVPLSEIASYFAQIGISLIIEFVPKEDSQVQRLLATREDVFPDYTEPSFVAAFERLFRIDRAETIPGTNRTLFLMRRRL